MKLPSSRTRMPESGPAECSVTPTSDCAQSCPAGPGGVQPCQRNGTPVPHYCTQSLEGGYRRDSGADELPLAAPSRPGTAQHVELQALGEPGETERHDGDDLADEQVVVGQHVVELGLDHEGEGEHDREGAEPV